MVALSCLESVLMAIKKKVQLRFYKVRAELILQAWLNIKLFELNVFELEDSSLVLHGYNLFTRANKIIDENSKISQQGS